MSRTPVSYLDIIERRHEKYELLLQQGKVYPLLLRLMLTFFCLLLIPLLIPYKSPAQSRLVRYTFHAAIVGLCVWTILKVRLLGTANGYGVGLVTFWFLVWSSTLLVFNDVQRDFKRIEQEWATVDGSVSVQDRKSDTELSSPRRSQRRVYHWQAFPDRFLHRLDWASDLIFNFRGPNWNWRVRSLLPLPEAVLKDIGGTTPVGEPAIADSWERLKHAYRSFLRDYIALDIIKVLMNCDAYFWGFVDPSPPPPFPFDVLAFSPVLIRCYRLLLSVAGILFALDFVTSLNPIFFLGISLAFPRFALLITHQPLDEAWMYPELFGSPMAVLDHGLAGAWNIWWHQLFRVGFSAAGRFLCALILPNKESTPRRYGLRERIVQVFVGFGLSGALHALGSYTQLADTKPLHAFLFFLLQAVGVFAQLFVTRFLLPKMPFSRRIPRWLRRAANLVFIVVWFYHTGPLLADDFARGGIWLFEPVPVSPLRGLGIGTIDEREGWWCVGKMFRHWDGGSWWLRGTALA